MRRAGLPAWGLIVTLSACDGEAVVIPPADEPRCPPPRVASAIVFGQVLDSDGSAVPDADVQIIGLQDDGQPEETIGACTGERALARDTTTDAEGFYRSVVSSVWVDSTCIVVQARAGELEGMASGATVELRANLGECTPESSFDSVEVDVVIGSQ